MGSFLSNTTTKPTAVLSVFWTFWFYLLCHHHSLGTSHISLSPSFACNKYIPAKSEWGTKILQVHLLFLGMLSFSFVTADQLCSRINYALEFQCSNILENPKVGWILFLKS
ncbi:hypothetical protein NC652_036714 [Populus alba x Populus x berolinensis]|nr:hypothetical protein NC652_036714 [Populus alba x Populus x berolinensis]